MGRLSDRTVRTAKAGIHSDGDGLVLRVKPSGAKSWVLRVQHEKQRRDIGLGSVDLRTFDVKMFEGEDPFAAVPLLYRKVLTLAEAREKAAALRKLAKSGADPIAARTRPVIVSVPTFEEAAKTCHEKGPPRCWAKKQQDQFLAGLKQHAFGKIGKLGVDKVEDVDVLDVLDPLWLAKPEMARKVRQAIRTVLDFAKENRWRPVGAPVVNPIKRFGKQPTGSGGFKMMPFKKVPLFVQELQAKAPTVGRLALLFTIFTACRGGEARKATWDQIDFEAKTWTRPAEMMKSEKEHVVTLNAQALAILEQAKAYRTKSSELVFPGSKGKELSDMTLLKILRDEELPYAVHGFRKSCRTWAGENGYAREIAEEALAHTVGNKVERTYNQATYLRQRRELLDAWGNYAAGAAGKAGE